MIRNSLTILAVGLLAACGVSKDKYAALEDQAKSCEERATMLDTGKQNCEAKLASVTYTTKELEQKTKTYEDLVGSLRSEINDGKIKISEMEGRLTVNLIDKILFDSGSAHILPEGMGALDKIAGVLKTVEGKRVQVEGHTDNVKLGPTLQKKFPTNWELSTARATSVARFMAEHGLPETRLSATGYSMFQPVATNDTVEGRRQNRRIEIVLVPELKVVPETPAPTANEPHASAE